MTLEKTFRIVNRLNKILFHENISIMENGKRSISKYKAIKLKITNSLIFKNKLHNIKIGLTIKNKVIKIIQLQALN